MAIGMLFQTAYYFVDLYFVARLGDAAVAGVGTAGNLQFFIMAVTQVLGVGTMVLISHCAGRKDAEEGTLVYNQSLTLAGITALLTLLLGYTAGFAWVDAIAASSETARLGRAYLAWFLPALALQFPLAAMMSTLRATGIARPTMVIQMATVGLNALLAPILITGWGTGYPMGVAGAALASVVAIVVANGLALVYFSRLEHFVRFDAARLRPHLATWRRMFGIGIPAALEFGLMFISMAEVAQFMASLLEGRLFTTPATLDTMLAPRSTEMSGYGLGIFGATVRGLRGYGHSGFWGTTAMVFPDAGRSIAIAVTEQRELRMANAVMGEVLALLGAGRSHEAFLARPSDSPAQGVAALRMCGGTVRTTRNMFRSWLST